MTRHDAELTGAVLRVLRDGPVFRGNDSRDRRCRRGAAARRRRARNGTARRAGVASGRARQSVRNDAARRRCRNGNPSPPPTSRSTRCNPIFIATSAATSLDDIARLSCASGAGGDREPRLRGRKRDRRRRPVPTPTRRRRGRARDRCGVARREAPADRLRHRARSTDIIHAAANVAWALHKQNPAALLSLAVPEANSLGMAMFGATSLEDSLARVAGEEPVIVVLENDLERRLPQRSARRRCWHARTSS